MLLLILSLVPLAPVDRFDIGELNHYYSDSGRLILTQVIYWDWNGVRHECQGWHPVKNGKTAPIRVGSEWRSVIWSNGVMRSIRFRQYKETHTTYDPEVGDRKILPTEQRKGLRSVLIR